MTETKDKVKYLSSPFNRFWRADMRFRTGFFWIAKRNIPWYNQ